jgi:protoporphyrinogen oxidase
MEQGSEVLMASYGVLGGGALGLTVALRLLQRGDEVVLFEREDMPGGLAAGFRVGPSYLEKFYHHLFRSDHAAIRLIEELGLGDKLVWPRPKTSTLRDGRIWQMDSAASVLRFKPLPLLDRLRMGAALAYLRVERDYHRLAGYTASEWIARWMGPHAYETLWKPLLVSKFGSRYGEISMPWFWARIHFRSASLGYLRGGFQQLYNALVTEIERLGGEVRLGTEVREIVQDGPYLRVVSDRGDDRFDRVVSTLATRLTIKLTPSLPESYRQRYGHVDAYGAHCLILALDRPLTEDTYWLNINDPEFPFLALVEHTNYMPPADYGGRHLVYLGNYLPMDHPLFRMSMEEIRDTFLPHLRRINADFSESWVTECWSFKAPFAQPIVTRDFPAHIPPHTTPLPNLFLANMFQVYPQDRGQNYSIALAERLVRDVLSQPSERRLAIISH